MIPSKKEINGVSLDHCVETSACLGFCCNFLIRVLALKGHHVFKCLDVAAGQRHSRMQVKTNRLVLILCSSQHEVYYL